MNLDNPIIADSPKKQLDEIASFQTQIEYKQFIDTVYHYITTHSIKDSICIGLEGSWGSGKSSIINFLQEKLNDTKEYQYVIFNPWYVTDTTNIISQFFAHIAARLSKTPRYKDISKHFQMLAEASEVIGATVSLVNPVVGAMLLVGGKALSFFAQNTKGGRGDIWKAKDELSKALRKLDKPILILIDDLDRLHKTEIRSMLTAIRAVGNLPNVIYVLAYDRAIVTDALESDGTNGHKFLEKIIQVKISVPLLNELDTYNYILDDITSRHIVSVDEVDGYKNVLIFIIDSIPTMRLANQLLNRFHYRYLYQMGQLCTFDLFLLSIIEVLAPPIIDLIISNPPTDEPEVPISWRLLSSKQRKQSFAHDLMKHFGSINEGLKKPVQPPNEVSQQNHFESKIYDVSARALREFRAITFISKILFDLDEITAFDDGLTGRPDFETGNYKHRLKEHIYFPYYFMYANERGCTPQQFESYMNLLRQGQRAFNQDEESSFRTLFINKCSYEFVASDIDVYITLLVQLTSDLTNKELPQTFDAIRNLIYNCIKYENDAIKVFDALINDNTKVLYLVFLYNLTTEEFSSSMQFRMASIAAMYKLKLEHQIAKNVTAQSKELPKSLYTGDVIEFLFTHRDNTNIQSALDKMISDDTFYLSYMITQLRKNKAGQYEVLSADRLPFFNREELSQRLPIIMKTAEYQQLDKDTKIIIEKILREQ